MGNIWLPKNLPDLLEDFGVTKCQLWDGWEGRSASQGGFIEVCGVVIHHTGSSGSNGEDNWEYATFNDDAAPEYNIGIDPDGTVNLLAGGGVNSSGKGGPLNLPTGRIDSNEGGSSAPANYRLVAICYGNTGTGSEQYGAEAIRNGARASAAILTHFKIPNSENVTSHKEWTGNQSVCPGRKIDPFGPCRDLNFDWGPQTGTAPFGLGQFRGMVDGYLDGVPEPTPTKSLSMFHDEGDPMFITQKDGVYWIGNGLGKRQLKDRDEIDTLISKFQLAGTPLRNFQGGQAVDNINDINESQQLFKLGVTVS